MLDSSLQATPSPVPSPGPALGGFDLPSLRAKFDEDGYIVLPGVVSKDTLEPVRGGLASEFERWQSSPAAFRGGGVLSGHLNCYPGNLARGVVDELRGKGVLNLAQQLFPTDPRRIRIGCNFNLPGSVAQHYHMDGIYLESFLVVNVCVVDTTLHNGAIELAPGTHQRFYRYCEFAAGRVYRRGIRVGMSQGDVLIRISTLWHRGMPNLSNAARPMLALTLGEKQVDTHDPFAFRDGEIEFQANWFRTNLLGRMRERTTVHAPITYAAYRFARSLVGNKGYDS